MKGNDKKIAAKSVVGVLDAGGQYVDLVQKAAERLGYPATVLPLDTPVKKLQKNYKAIIISGSPASSQAEDAPMPDPALWELGIPIMGVCYGLHAMVTAFGGKVERGTTRQDGRFTTTVDTKHPLFNSVKASFFALFTHGNFVTEVPRDFEIIGQHKLQNGKTVYSAIAKGTIVGVQFHPEVFDDTPEGYQVYKNFLGTIAGLKSDPDFLDRKMDELATRLRKNIRNQAKGKDVIAFVSGGVDSSVTAALAATEIPADKLHAYYIDNGLMRREDDAVIDSLQSLDIPIQKVEAAQDFLEPLRDVTDPQTKRRIIGKTFIDIQNRLITNLGLKEALLLQGTNAADRIESGYSKGGTHTALIKTHHNVVQEVRELKDRGLLIEPLDELFKDEVRALGRHLGLPSELVERQPFPGPGLAVRVLCATGEETTDGGQKTTKAIQQFLKTQPGLETTKTTAVLLPVRNVGVGGDERSHVSAVALKSFAPWELLGQLAITIPGTFRDQVNRVVVALGSQPLSELSLTPTFLLHKELEQLRHADSIVHEQMRSHRLLTQITQFPVVLLPLSFGESGKRSIVLRPLITSAFLTVQAMIPSRDLPVEFITSTAERILAEVPGISQVFIDLTNKPPATTEWE